MKLIKLTNNYDDGYQLTRMFLQRGPELEAVALDDSSKETLSQFVEHYIQEFLDLYEEDWAIPQEEVERRLKEAAHDPELLFGLASRIYEIEAGLEQLLTDTTPGEWSRIDYELTIPPEEELILQAASGPHGSPHQLVAVVDGIALCSTQGQFPGPLLYTAVNKRCGIWSRSVGYYYTAELAYLHALGYKYNVAGFGRVVTKLLEVPTERPKFTVFCQQKDGKGTIYITSVVAETSDEAAELGLAECLEDWNGGGEKWTAENVHVLGVARGSVDICEWNDLCV